MKIKPAVFVNHQKDLNIPDVFIHNLCSKLLDTLKNVGTDLALELMNSTLPLSNTEENIVIISFRSFPAPKFACSFFCSVH